MTDGGGTSKEVFPGVFDRHAAAYRDRVMGALGRGELRGRARALELLALRPGDRALDLGCGPGTLTLSMARAVGPAGLVVGVDLAAGMLALARSSAPAPAAFVRMDMERLALRDSAFDAVACGHALQFCPDLGLALREARRVLRPGGRFAGSVPAGGGSGAAGQILEEALSRRVPESPEPEDGARTAGVVRDGRMVREALAAAGLRGAAVARVEEAVSFASPRDLVDQTMRWWSWAWRLEALSPAAREAVRGEALTLVRDRFGDGPLELSGASLVLSGVR